MTVTLPMLPALAAMRLTPLLTAPPAAMLITPWLEALAPMAKFPLALVKAESAPVTVRLPEPLAPLPIVVAPAVTVPPAATVSWPLLPPRAAIADDHGLPTCGEARAGARHRQQAAAEVLVAQG